MSSTKATIDRVQEADEAQIFPRLVTIVEAAKLLGIGRTTVYELIAEGELEVVHIHRSARIAIDAIDEYMARLRGQASRERERFDMAWSARGRARHG